MQPLRRTVCAALSAMALSLVGAACTSGADPEPGPTATPSPSASSSTTAAAEPATLRFATFGDSRMRATYEELSRTYTQDHPEVTIHVEHSRTEQRAAERLREAIDTGDPPDLFVASSERVPALSAADEVQPVEELLAARGVIFGDTYQRLGLEALSAEQHLQCMPFDVSPQVVFYHRGLLPLHRLVEPGEERPTPETGWTWDQFAKAARLMSRDGVKGVYVEPRFSTLIALIRSAGADVVDDPRAATTLTLSEDGTRDALEEILSVLREPRVTPSPRQLARSDGLTRFAEEKVGMVVGTRALVPQLREAGVDFDVFPLPRLGRARTIADVSGYCLAAASEEVRAAADFLAFAVGEEGAAVLAETGAVVPSHLPTLNSDSFIQQGEPPGSVDVFVDALAGASVHPYVPGWPELVTWLHPQLEELFYAPVLDLDTRLPVLDERSREFLAPEETVEQ